MKNKYCFGEFISNALAFIITKIFYQPARLIKRPLYLRGRRSVIFGKGVKIGHSCRFDLDGRKKTLFIGENCEIGDYSHIVAYQEVRIGNNVLCASKVYISDTNHGHYVGERQDNPDIPPNARTLAHSSVCIGDNVWIGENVVILAGSMIGSGCIIGANAVISKTIPDNSMVVGANCILKRWDHQTRKWEKINNE